MPALVQEMQFWTMTAEQSLTQLETSPDGLTTETANQRAIEYEDSRLGRKKESGPFRLFLSQFNSPIIWLLLVAALLSLTLGEATDAAIVFVIVLLSGLLGFFQEHGAAGAMARLVEIVQVKVDVIRDGKGTEVPLEAVVPGDVLNLKAGDLVPGDCRVLTSHDLFTDESSLTGESFPIEKQIDILPTETPLAKRSNLLFLGTHVVSGTGSAVVTAVGTHTQFGKLSETLRARAPETEFQHGIRRFGALLMQITLLLVIAMLAINVYLKRPVVDSLLFALAIAVGLTPQLLPAIISINLSHGAKRMAALKVIVKRLASIQNLGSMDVLCTDKTGTLTEGIIKLDSIVGLDGKHSEAAFKAAQINSSFQSAYANPIDQAIADGSKSNLQGINKLDEKPYDFTRKCLSVLVQGPEGVELVTKGALKEILAICSYVNPSDTNSGSSANSGLIPIGPNLPKIQALFEEASTNGFRTLGVCVRQLPGATKIDAQSERDMTFLGLILLEDPLKAGIVDALNRLRTAGITPKVISGDNQLIAKCIATKAGLQGDVMTGEQIEKLSEAALAIRASKIHIFAEVEPNQKEHIIRALRRAGHVVGYMGDGINDAPALHAAGASISVSNAVDVAKSAADIVLLEKDLNVLVDGVSEGRITFANTMKYIFMATSANFGNMFSMAGASLFLPFLPMLPKQILLTNLMTDMPEMSIATDRVDPIMTATPHRWDIGFIARFMVVFGLTNSLCDYATFYVLLHWLKSGAVRFRTGWFIENVVTAALIVLVIRTNGPFWKSKPSRPLLLATLASVGLVLVIPYTPLAGPLGLEAIPANFLGALAVITAVYVVVAETAKYFFYRHDPVRRQPVVRKSGIKRA